MATSHEANRRREAEANEDAAAAEEEDVCLHAGSYAPAAASERAQARVCVQSSGEEKWRSIAHSKKAQARMCVRSSGEEERRSITHSKKERKKERRIHNEPLGACARDVIE